MPYYDKWSYGMDLHRRTMIGSLQAVRDQFPKRWRKKSVLCPVTGEETTAPDGLSVRAWDLIQKGLEYERFLEDQVAEPYMVDRSWVGAFGLRDPETGAPYPGDEKHYASDWSLISFVAALLGQRLQEAPWNCEYPRLDEGNNRREPRRVVIHLTKFQADLVKKTATLIQWWVKDREKSGYRSGSSFVTQLAEGSLTMEQINEAHIRRE